MLYQFLSIYFLVCWLKKRKTHLDTSYACNIKPTLHEKASQCKEIFIVTNV